MDTNGIVNVDTTSGTACGVRHTYITHPLYHKHWFCIFPRISPEADGSGDLYSKLNKICLGCFDPINILVCDKDNHFWGELTDVSAKTNKMDSSCCATFPKTVVAKVGMCESWRQA